MPDIEDVILEWMGQWDSPVSAWEIAERFRLMGVPATGVKSAVKRLHKEGHITCDYSDKDRAAPSDYSPVRYSLRPKP